MKWGPAWLFSGLWMLTLAGCAGQPGPTSMSPAQSLYAAFAGYSAAVAAAADYAETPDAEPAIVRAAAAANRSPGVVGAKRFARTFALCRGSSAAVVPGADCATLDLRPTTLTGYAQVLRSAAFNLLHREE